MPSPEPGGRLDKRVRDQEPYVGSGSLGEDDLRRIDCFKQLISAQCFALADTIVEQYATQLEDFSNERGNLERLRQADAEARELRTKTSTLEDQLRHCQRQIAQQRAEIEALRAASVAVEDGENGASDMPQPPRLPTTEFLTKESRVALRPGAPSPTVPVGRPSKPVADSMAMTYTLNVEQPRRLVVFADLSPECDDECALLYMLSDLNNNDIPATIELIVADCKARFRWMEHIFHGKFHDERDWKLYDDDSGFTIGCVQVNLYLLHQPHREEMVTKELQKKVPSLQLDKPGYLKFLDHTEVPAGSADLILMAAPVPELDPAFFSRFTDLQGVYVVGTPGGVNCQQPTWGNLLFALHQLAQVIYLSPQFTRTVCFPKDYVQENPHWTWYMKRTVFEGALTVMARRPEIPAKFGDWGLILRLNAANAKLCKQWYEDVMKTGMESVETCPAYIKSIVQAYVSRNSGDDRKPGAVRQELELLGVHSRAALDAKGAPASPEDLQVLKADYQKQLFESVYACIMATETLLFQNQANLQPQGGADRFLTLVPRCGYSDPHESLANIYGVEEAIGILRGLPIHSLTPAYDMVGAICALTYLKDGDFDSVDLEMVPAQASMSSDLFHSDDTSEHPIWHVGVQSEACIEKVVHMLRSHVRNDPLLVIDEFWAHWRHKHTEASGTDNLSYSTKIHLDSRKSIGDLGETVAGATISDTRWMRHLMLHPNSYPHMVWAFLCMVLVCYDCVMVPLMSFDVQENDTLILAISIFWTIDLIKNFFLGFYYHGVIEMRPAKVARHYLRTWFAIDITIVSVDWVSLFQQGFGYVALLRVSRAIRLGRLLQMSKVNRFLTTLEDSFITASSIEYVIRVSKMIFAIFSVTHFVACAWYFLGAPESNPERYRAGPDSMDVGWVTKAGLEIESTDLLYFTCVHWAFAHLLLGEVDVTPSTTQERIYSVFIHSIGLIVFSSFVSSLTELMAHAAEESVEKSKRDSEVREYMEDHLVSVKLMSCIDNYRRHARQHANKQKLPRQSIDGLQNLPFTLAVKLSEEVYMRILNTHGFFATCYEHMPAHLTSVVHKTAREEYVAPDSEIFLLGQDAECVYIIAKGHVTYTKDSAKHSASDGEWVSEPALWLGNWKRRGDLWSKSSVELLALQIDTFRERVAESYSSGLYACQFAELVARGVDPSTNPFASMSDLDLDMEGRATFAERAMTW